MKQLKRSELCNGQHTRLPNQEHKESTESQKSQFIRRFEGLVHSIEKGYQHHRLATRATRATRARGGNMRRQATKAARKNRTARSAPAATTTTTTTTTATSHRRKAKSKLSNAACTTTRRPKRSARTSSSAAVTKRRRRPNHHHHHHRKRQTAAARVSHSAATTAASHHLQKQTTSSTTTTTATVSLQELEDVRAMNTTHRLASKLFEESEYPTDHKRLRSLFGDKLPNQLDSISDFEKWMSAEPHLSPEGKRRFQVLRALASEEFTPQVVENATPLPLVPVPPAESRVHTPVASSGSRGSSPETQAPKTADPPSITAPTSHTQQQQQLPSGGYIPPHTTDTPRALTALSVPADTHSTPDSVADADEAAADENRGASSSVSATHKQQQQPSAEQNGSHDDEYAQQLLHQQLKFTPEQKRHYEQMALKEADQRQLLMLLCGDVEADMFFDEAGEMRHPKQIIDQTLFLLEPYQLSNSKMGTWTKRIQFYTNYAWHYGTTVAMIVVSIMSMYHIGLFMMASMRSVHGTRAYHRAVREVLNRAGFVLVGLMNQVVGVLSKCMCVSNTGRMFSGRLGMEFVRMLCVGGPPAMLWWVLTRTKVDYSAHEELSLAMYAVRTLHDRQKQLDAMHYLAHLSPGLLGSGDMASGITTGQLGMICRMQDELVKLDKQVDNMTQAEYAKTVAFYNRTFRGVGMTDKRINLGQLLGHAFNAALHQPVTAQTQAELVAFRKELLTTYRQDMRCFHFLDAYGHPRSKLDICKAFFIYWQQCEQSQRLPTIPYEGKGTLAEQLQLTPLAQLRTKRRHMSTQTNIPNTWWRQHPFLYKNDRTPIDLQETLNTEPAEVLSLLDIGNQAAVRKHRGWTHRISKIGRHNLVERFHLSTMLLSEEYDMVKRHQGVERKQLLEKREEVAGSDRWNTQRDTDVHEGGVRVRSPPAPTALTAAQDPAKTE